MDETLNTTTPQGQEEGQSQGEMPQRPQRPPRTRRPPPSDPNRVGQNRARNPRAPRPTPNSETPADQTNPNSTTPIPRRTRTPRPPRYPAEVEAAAQGVPTPPPVQEPEVVVQTPAAAETSLTNETKSRKRKPNLPPSPIVEVAAEDIPEKVIEPPNTEQVEKAVLNIALILFTNIGISFFHISSLALMEFSKTGNAIGISGLAFVFTTTLLPILLANLTAKSLLKFVAPQTTMPALWDWTTSILFFLHFFPHFLNAIGFNIWYLQQFY